MYKILVVDDDPEFRESIVSILKPADYEVTEAATPADALARVREIPFDVVLLDFVMPKVNGLDLLPQVKKLRPKIKVVMITAFATVEIAVEAIKRGASDFISKPFRIDALAPTINRILEEARVEEADRGITVDSTLHSLAHIIRRKIMKLLMVNPTMRLTELTNELGMEDHTKVFFHLKIMREAGLVTKIDPKTYSLTPDGIQAIECLKIVEDHFTGL